MTRSLKGKILVISPTVPRPDMNSGDLRLYSILSILVQEYAISFVPAKIMAGDETYVSQLERNHITVHAEQVALRKLLETERFKFAILEFYFTAEYYLDRIRILQPECRVVVDSVDVHYLRHQLKSDLTGDAADHAVYRETKKRELAVYRKADAVLTVTRDDADALVRECPDITCELVPNIHELRLSDTQPECETLIFVGGFAHPPNVDAVHYFCGDILPRVRRTKPGVKCMIVGSNPPEEIRALANEGLAVTGYVPEVTPYLHRSRVSVAPLRYGAGMKGKVGEAMAHGIPVVTTSVGAQGMGLANRKDVMIADSPEAFAAAVVELLDDGALYGAIRRNAIQIIEDNFTPQLVGQAMSAALERIGRKPAKWMKPYEKVAFFNKYVMQRIKTALFMLMST